MHGLHTELPERAAKRPAAHLEHSLAPARENVPGEHGEGSDEPVAHAEPAGQAAHSAALCRWVRFENVPSGQGVGVMLPTGQWYPAGHSCGVTVETLGQKKPIGHGPWQSALV